MFFLSVPLFGIFSENFIFMKLIPVVINGKIHRMSERALEILGLEKIKRNEKPIEIRNLPPNLEIIKIVKKEAAPVVKDEEPKAEEPAEVVKAEAPVVVKKRGCANCGKRKKA